MRMEVTLTGAGLDALGARTALYAQEACDASAEAIVHAAKETVEEIHGAGVKYSGLPDRSSAPGQPPQSQHGDLVETIRTAPMDVVGIGTDAVAGDGSGVATDLEAGTSRMAPRPFLGPAAEAALPAAEASLEEIAAALREG